MLESDLGPNHKSNFEFNFIKKKKKKKKNDDYKNKIPYSEPTINNNVLLKIYDWDCGKADELVGSCAFNKDDIHEGMVKKKNNKTKNPK